MKGILKREKELERETKEGQVSHAKMNTSLHCSANSAFSIPGIEHGCNFLPIERTSQLSQENIDPFYEQREPQVIQPTPICLENYNSFHSPFYATIAAQSSMSLPVIPLPFLHDFGFETGFIRKRNERERMRVRTVNEGYARLRDHLPLEISEKRMSKVETLRAAIKYIKYLQEILEETPERETATEPCKKKRKLQSEGIC